MVLYALLLSVVYLCLRSVWVGLTDLDRYHAVFPGASGPLYWSTLTASSAAAITAIFIALRKRAAVMVNPFVGLASIVLLEFVRAPRLNQVVILAAATLTTIIPWYLWFSKAPRGHTGPPDLT